jgi:hypothetical protein
MFCPSCGAEYAIELNYCNRCGANLNLAANAATEAVQVNVTKPVLILGVIMLFLTLGGFAGVISGAIEVAKSAGGGDLSMAIVFFGLATILIVDIFLARLLSKLVNASLASNRSAPRKSIQPNTQPQLELPRPLPPRFEPVASVTDHTTRFFDPSYRSPAESPQPKAVREHD